MASVIRFESVKVTDLGGIKYLGIMDVSDYEGMLEFVGSCGNLYVVKISVSQFVEVVKYLKNLEELCEIECVKGEWGKKEDEALKCVSEDIKVTVKSVDESYKIKKEYWV